MSTNPEEMQNLTIDIQPAEVVDSPQITDVFIRSRAGMDYIDPGLHSPQETEDWFTGIIADESNTVQKAVSGKKITGFSVVRDGWVDHLYIDPAKQSHSIGSKLLHEAQSVNSELQLWVFQRNSGAIQLYERNGFKLVEQTDGSSNEERLPDARYIWRRKN